MIANILYSEELVYNFQWENSFSFLRVPPPYALAQGGVPFAVRCSGLVLPLAIAENL